MSRITDSARGRDCELKLPGVCCGDPEQTVWAHSNSIEHGKGRSLKAYDQNGAYACYPCHMVYDGQYARPAGLTRAMVDCAFAVAMTVSQGILITLRLWDGESNAPRAQKRLAKSRKIPVTGKSLLQRQCVPAIGNEPVGDIRGCRRCAHLFDADLLGVDGCPNCEGGA